MLGVNERRESAAFLRVGDDVQHERGFAGRFRPENFDDAAARDAADAQGEVQRERAGRNHVNLDQRPRVAEAHDAAFAVAFGDGGDGGFEFALVRRSGLGFSGRFFGNFRRHNFFLSEPYVVGLTERDSSESPGNSQMPDGADGAQPGTAADSLAPPKGREGRGEGI